MHWYNPKTRSVEDTSVKSRSFCNLLQAQSPATAP